jgi:hypothetical protein
MLKGHEAIEYAERHGVTLNKYADPTEGAREGLTVEEARDVASEDPSLIHLPHEQAMKLTAQDLATLEELGITVYADEGGSVSLGDSSGPYDAVTVESVRAACDAVRGAEFTGDEDRPASAYRFEAFHDAMAAAGGSPTEER